MRATALPYAVYWRCAEIARGGRRSREEQAMGDLLWPIAIVSFLGVVFFLVVSFIRIALGDHNSSSAEPTPTNA
jgi:hypothetical protein